jgi:hypothetical protein
MMVNKGKDKRRMAQDEGRMIADLREISHVYKKTERD